MGDIVFQTDNPIFLKGSQKDLTNPITYDKQPAPSHKINHRNFVETDIRGFGTKVGTYSNYSTIIEAMLPLFKGSGQEKQREELLTRKKLLREINGQEIDRIKGVDAKGPPKEEWLKFQEIDPLDDDVTKSSKYYHNSLVISKKPYFFRYLYPELNKKYKQYEAAYNEKSKALFRMKLKKLLVKTDKTEAEKTLIKRYHKFSPLINTNCTMNILCRELENVDFDINYAKGNDCVLPYYDLDTFKFNPDVLRQFRDMYRRWSNKKQLNYINSLYNDRDEEYEEVRFKVVDIIKEDLQEELNKLELKPMETLTYIKALSQSYANFNFGFAYDLLGDLVLECVEHKEAYAPVESEFGKEYLGRNFVLKKVEEVENESII